jgi:hypothetical protein
MSNFIRIESLSVSVFFNTRPGSHSWIESQSRPIASPSLYNPTDRDITITIPAKTTAYLPGMFVQDKYGANASATLEDGVISLMQPIDDTLPVLKSGKIRS